MNPLWLLAIVLVLAGLALLGYTLHALDAAGSIASFLLGLVVALLGGLDWLAVMVLFTALGFAATWFGARRKRELRVEEARGGERGLSNVLANGGAAVLAALSVLLAGQGILAMDAVKLAFVTAVAAVTADTLASEIGTLSARARLILPPFKRAQAGENGGVSWLGQAAALAGSLAITGAAVWFMEIPADVAWVPAVGGFLGCQLDSLLGATLERDVRRHGPLSKADVNFIASFVPAFVVLVAVTLSG